MEEGSSTIIRMIYHLIYSSKATSQINEQEIEDILRTSRKFNEERSITGYLIFISEKAKPLSSGIFMQVLEGEKDAVESLYEDIQKDDRHTDLNKLVCESIDERNFPGWDMGYDALDLEEYPFLGQIFEMKPEIFALDPKITSSILLNFMKSFYGQSREANP